ncbi:serine/threonine-protein kinase [Sanguibacter antarcticus]|uniref:non-specific serine/threonine protein kinase n=1 Tax=Sanguibacter antarcticus TaxID=372484 RepID=A0A2A9E7X7_9MICO|nr:serine/threonine-protein kinase [Sanguibacter antarcticus]PFG34756.1 serine/threonine-protein kinase [Sanguibacter antarcticus]
MRPAAGIALGGRYRLVRLIAIGGMGEVWVAHDESLARDVAVKVLREEFAGNADFLDRLRTEARNSAALSHSNIAQLYDYGEQAASGYLVMELVIGEPMSDLLEREPVLPVLRLLSILSQTARALHAAHVAGVVHRDVKPGNILLERTGEVKITDFGVSLAANQVPMTAAGMVMGTAQYLSPEQAIGKAATGASDIYALGIVAYESIVGNRPFTGASPVDIAVAHVNEPVPPLTKSIHPGFADLIMRMLSKDPLDRPRSGAILARNFDLLAEEIAADPWGSGLRRRGNSSPPGRRETFTPAPDKAAPASDVTSRRPRSGQPSHLAGGARGPIEEPPATTRAGQRIAAGQAAGRREGSLAASPPPAHEPAPPRREGRLATPVAPPTLPPVPQPPTPPSIQLPTPPPTPAVSRERSAAPAARPVHERSAGPSPTRASLNAASRPAARRTPLPRGATARGSAQGKSHSRFEAPDLAGSTPSSPTRQASRRFSEGSSSGRSSSSHRTAPTSQRRTSTTTGQRIGNLGWPTIALVLLVLVIVLATIVKAIVNGGGSTNEGMTSHGMYPVSVQSTSGILMDGMIDDDAVRGSSAPDGTTTPRTPKDA